MRTNKKKTWLSHSGLEILERCPRCFWLKYREGINQPEEIVSRLPDRFDRVIKNYFQRFRGTLHLPPLIAGRVEGVLENPFKDTYFYGIDQDFGFYGKLDECLVHGEAFIPVDFKTSSSDPRGKTMFPAYQNQMNAYSFLLEKNGKKPLGFGYIIYFYPEESSELHNGFPMLCHVQKVETSNGKAMEERFAKAIEVLRRDIPQSSPTCAYCAWYEGLSKILMGSA